MSPLSEAIAARIRGELETRSISERELARRLGVPRMYLRRRLLGEVEFRPSDIEAIAAALGVDPSRFLAEEAV